MEEHWIQRARAGDESAFEALVRKHQRAVYGLAMRMMKDHGEADEITQKTFLRAWDHLADFEGRASLRPALLRIAVNLCKNQHRDRARFVEATPQRIERSADAIGSERLEHEERLDRLRAAVARLPEKQRLTVELRIYQSLSFEEIAEVLDGTGNAAKVNFHFAVKALKALAGLELEKEKAS